MGEERVGQEDGMQQREADWPIRMIVVSTNTQATPRQVTRWKEGGREGGREGVSE